MSFERHNPYSHELGRVCAHCFSTGPFLADDDGNSFCSFACRNEFTAKQKAREIRCANCSRPINGGIPYYYSGPDAFCSPMCSDVRDARGSTRSGDELGTYPGTLLGRDPNHPSVIAEKLAEEKLQADLYRAVVCEIPGCQVCSGAIRSRAGKGDQS